MYRVRRKRLLDYFFPPLILIAVIMTVVLSLHLYRLITAGQERVQLTIQQGGVHATVTPSGVSDSVAGKDTMPLFSEDRVHSGQASVDIALRSFSGVQQALFTLDPDTDVLFQKVSQSGSEIALSMLVSRGRLSIVFADDVTRVASGTTTTLSISLPHLRVTRAFASDRSASFSVGADSGVMREKVTYIDGEDPIKVESLVDRGGVLQEAESYDLLPKNALTLDSAAYAALSKYQSPELIEAIPDTSVP